MTAIEIYEKLTGDTELSDFYVSMAEDTVREYLGYDAEKAVDRFSQTIAKIASYMSKKDTAERNAEKIAAKSESFSEGGVSVSHTYDSMADVIAQYDSAIAGCLNSIQRYRIGRVVRGGQ